MTPTAAEKRPVLVDTSAAVPLVAERHPDHEQVSDALEGLKLGLSGHATFETYSVLTRLPPPNRRHPLAVAEILQASFPETRYLGAQSAIDLVGQLSSLRIAGGSTFDALVAACAAEHELALASRDWRARDTYRALGVDVLMV